MSGSLENVGLKLARATVEVDATVRVKNRNDLNRAVASFNPLAQLADLPVGLTVLDAEASLHDFIMTTVTKEAATAGRNLGFNFPKVAKVKVLVAGTERNVEHARLLHGPNALDATAAVVNFPNVGTRKAVNFLSPEAVWVLLKEINQVRDTPVLWIFMQALEGGVNALDADALSRLREAAKASRSYVIAILATTDIVENTHLDDLADEYVKVEECEPDFGDGVAFAFDLHGIRSMNQFGFGKVMCTLRIDADGRYERIFAPFVAAGFSDRCIRILRGRGRIMSEIAETVGVDKSTISRHLKGWQRKKVDVPDGWEELVKEHFQYGGSEDFSPKQQGRVRELFDDGEEDEA